MQRSASLRAYLVLLVAAAVAPLLLVQLFYVREQSAHDTSTAGSTANALAEISARNVNRFIADTGRLLRLLSDQPAVRELDIDNLDPLLSGFTRIYPQFTNILVVGTQGQILYSARPSVPQDLRADQASWFGKLMRSQELVVGEPRLGPISGRWVTMIALPVRDHTLRIVGALAVPVDLVQVEHLFQEVLPPGSVLTVLDAKGTILSRSSEAEKWVGVRVDESWQDQLSQIPAQGLRVRGLDQQERIYGRAKVPALNWEVYLGIPIDVALASGQEILRRSLVLGFVAFFLAVSLALAVSRRVRRPIQQLAEYCRQDGPPRFPPEISGPVEIQEMAAAFRDMVARDRDYLSTLEESRAWLGLAIRSAKIGLWERNLEDGSVHYSREWKAQLGYRDEEIQDRQEEFDLRLHPDDRTRLQEAVDNLASELDLDWPRDEFRLLHKDGAYRWFLSQASVLRDESGAPVRLLGGHIEITDRKRAEERLKRALERFEAVVKATNDAIWDWDIAQDQITWHDASQTLLGFPRAHSIWRSAQWFNAIHPRDRARVKTSIEDLISGTDNSWAGEYRLRVNSSTYLHIQDRARLIRDPQGYAVRLIGAKQDISDRKKTEEVLYRAKRRLEKLSSTLLRAQEAEQRRIARELHDEVGQTLTATKINLEALRRFPDPMFLERRLRDTIELVERAIRTIRDLSLSLRPPMLDDLGLGPALQWLTRQMGERSGFEAEIRIPEDSVQLGAEAETACFRVAQEALTNISRHAGASRVIVNLKQDGGNVRLSIQDNGIGFDVHAKRSLAERGHSFGLLGMEERAALAGGRIEWVSHPGQGTEVILEFPVSQANRRVVEVGRGQ